MREIDEGLSEARRGHAKVSGNIRLTVLEHPAEKIVIPALKSFLAAFPDVTVDLDVSDHLTDIVAGGFDAGTRLNDIWNRIWWRCRLGPTCAP